MEKDVENFLKELTELTEKYKIVIGGCGCCGSPYLSDLNGELTLNGLMHDELSYSPDNGYFMKNIYELEGDEMECTQ